MYCGKCGAKNNKNSVICKKCKEKLDNNENDNLVEEKKSKKRVFVIVFIFIILLILTIIAIILFFDLKNDNQKEKLDSIEEKNLEDKVDSNITERNEDINDEIQDLEEDDIQVDFKDFVYITISLDSKILTTFTYPIMRNSQYDKISYYQKDSLTMSDFSNNDILYNALIHVYTGFISPYKGSYTGDYCGTAETKKMVNSKYLEARIDNLFSKNTKYEHQTFKVPSTNKDTPYVGTWIYDAKTKMYIYYGDCEGVTPSNVVYYDLKKMYEANGNENNTVIDVTYHMGFAEVDTTTKAYTIYSDADMTNVLTSGTLTSNNYKQELDNVFNDYLSNAKSYKYTFSSNHCFFQDYCFEKGEWVK